MLFDSSHRIPQQSRRCRTLAILALGVAGFALSVGEANAQVLTLDVDAAIIDLDTRVTANTDRLDVLTDDYAATQALARQLDTRTTGLQDNVATVVGDLDDLSAQVKVNTGDIRAQGGLIGDNAAAIRANVGTIDSLGARVDTVERLDANLRDMADANADAVGALDTRVGKVETANANLRTKVGANTDAIGNVNSRLGDLQTATGDLRGRVDTQRGLIDDNMNGLADLGGRVSVNTAGLADLDARVTANGVDIGGLQGNVSDINTQLADLNARLEAGVGIGVGVGGGGAGGGNGGNGGAGGDGGGNGGGGTQTNTNTTDIRINSTRIDKNETNITNNRNDINQNRTDIRNNSNRIDRNETDIRTNTNRIDRNEQNIRRNGTQIANNRSDIDRHDSEINSLDQRTTTNEQDIDGLDKRTTQNSNDIASNRDSIDRVEDRVSTNEENIDSLGDRVATNENDIDDIHKTDKNQDRRIDANSDAIVSLQKKAGNGLVQQKSKNAKVTVAANTGGSEIDVSGTEGDRRISGVAAGTRPDDAANVAQVQAMGNSALNQAEDYTDRSLAAFERQQDNRTRALISDNNRSLHRYMDAIAATSSALSALPQPIIPGKGMVSAGVGGHGSQVAFALGVAKAFDTEHTPVVRAGVSFDTAGGDASYNAAVGIHF